MNCPYCHQSMEQGTLRSRGGLFFLPKGENLPKLYTEKEMAAHDAISFPPRPFDVPPDYPAAFACRSCKILMMEFEEG